MSKRNGLRGWTVRVVCAILGVLGLSALAAGAPDAAAEKAFQLRFAAQMAAIAKEKASWTPAQKKMASQLIHAQRQQQGAVAAALSSVRPQVDTNAAGLVLVDIDAAVTPGLLARIAEVGGTVVNSFARYHAIRAWLPVDQIEALAGLPDVKYIRPAVKAVCNIGSVTSEGDVTHRAVNARTTYGIDGTGVKVGVLSDGVTHLAHSQGTGDLGTVTVLSGQAGSGDEGTAMLEIVHDLAPGAQLYFATGFSGVASMAQNIRNLRTAGCDIIIDDITYFNESPFQDGPIAQAVNDVCANGALYFSSAANSGNKDSATACTWEGDFVDGGASTIPNESGRVHSFGGTLYNATTAGAGTLTVNLLWADPLGGSSNDYDLFLTNAAGTVLAYSADTQSGTQDPYEAFQYANAPAGSRIVIILYSGAARFMHLDTQRVPLAITTSGNTRGHNAAVAANAFCVAAAPAHTALTAGYPAGPYPNPFSGTSAYEPFSSDGPRRMFFQTNGTPYTPGNFSSTGGVVFQKPDITAADGVATSMSAAVTGGVDFSTFYGTSAAAPHAGAIAALIKSAQPSLTPAQIRAAMTGTAIDISAATWDRDTGVGIVMPDSAIANVYSSTTTTSTTTTTTASTTTSTTTTTIPSGTTSTTVATTTTTLATTTTTAATTTTTAATTTTTLPDTQPPTVTGQFPAPNAWNAENDTIIQLHVTDARSGVNAATVLIEASLDQLLWDTISDGSASYDASGNVTFKGKTTRAGTPADYVYVYQASMSFDYETTLYFRVNASDLKGNVMPQLVYSITTETRSFGANVRVDGGTAGDDCAATARDTAGTIWVAWQRVGTDGVGRIFIARKVKGADQFGAEAEVLPGANDRRRPVLAAAPGGKMWIAWETADLNIVEVASADIAAPTTWTQAPVVPAPIGHTQLQHPAMAVDSTGNTVYLAFETSNGGATEIGAVSLASGAANWSTLAGAPVGPVSVEAGTKVDPAIAIGYLDMVYIAWANATDGGIYACQYLPGGGTFNSNGRLVNGGAAGKPALFAENTSYSLHAVWMQAGGTPNPDILYANSTATWVGPLAGTSVTHNDSGAQLAGSPKVMINYDVSPYKVFVIWQDKRSSVANDTDILFAETRFDKSFGTNLRVSADASNSPQMSPAIGFTSDGSPYAAWTDLRGGASHIYYSEATDTVYYDAAWTVSAAGGSHTFANATSTRMSSVDVSVPPGVFDPPRDLSISELVSPDVPCPGGFGLYFDFGGSADQVLSNWVTITLHGVASAPTPLAVYRYVPPVSPLASGTWTHDYIQNEQYNATTQTLSFQTKHLSSFGGGTASTSGGGSTSGTGSSSGGGGGGCAMSTNAGADWSLLLLPLAAAAVAVVLRLRRRTAR